MSVRIFTIVAFIVLRVQSPCPAQVSPVTLALLDAEHQAGLGKYGDAIDIYQRVLDTAADGLVPVLPPLAACAPVFGSPVYALPWSSPLRRPARWLIHDAIRRWPAEALGQYRDRVDATAGKRLEAAKLRVDDEPLVKLVNEYFNSTPGERALLLLAQRHIDRGEIPEASHYWRMLLTDYPDPATPRSLLEARWLMSRLFLGEAERVRRLLPLYRERYPDAVGTLAEREGKLADTLALLLNQPRHTTLQPPPEDGRVWSTFGGKPTRDSFFQFGLPRDWPGIVPNWSAELPGELTRRKDEPVSAPDHPRPLAFHPVIGHGRAFVASAMRIDSYELASGRHSPVFEPGRTFSAANTDTRLPVRDDARFTLTLADRFLYARIGARSLRLPRDGTTEPHESGTALVALGPIADDPKLPIPHAWTLRPPAAAKEAVSMFEGAPLVVGRKLYVQLWQQTGGAATTSLACYELPERGRLPELLWLREVGSAAGMPTAEPRTRHDLLTLAGRNIVVGTNAGIIAALDRRTGLPAWDYQYGRNEKRGALPYRELCPCLFDGEHLFAAPADSDRLLCIDAFTGRLLWERDGLDIVHLLGVTKGRLIATTSGQMKGIRGLAVHTGSERFPEGWVQHTDGGTGTVGRGLLSPDVVYWPTREGLQFLNPLDGSPARQPVAGLFGNIAFVQGCFIVTDAKTIHGYVR